MNQQTTRHIIKDDPMPDEWDVFGDDRNWDWDFGDQNADQQSA